MPWWAPWRRIRDEAEPSRSISSPYLAALLGAGGDGSLPVVSERTALTLSAVWRALSLGAGSIGTLPMRTLQTNRDGTRERIGSFLDDPGFGQWTAFEWKELCAIHLWFHGNAYCQHVYNGAGALAGLNLVHPLAVEVEWDNDRPGGRKYTVRLTNTVTKTFDASTLTHIPGLSLDGLKGISPISRARLSLGSALAGDKAASRMMTNGAMIAGLVTPDGDEDLSEPEAKVVKETIQSAMMGVENAGDVAVINRRLKFSPWQMSAVDAEFMASRDFAIDEVGRWFGIPPHLLGLVEKSTSWGQGIAEQNRGLARYTLAPWTTRIEQRLSRLLAGKKKVEFDYTQFIAPSPEDEIGLLLSQVNGGLITPNEARRIRNMPPVDGGDILRIPAGAANPNDANQSQSQPENAP